jgi:hypothetical protein
VQQPIVNHAAPTPPTDRWIALTMGYETLDDGGLTLAKISGDKLVTVANELPGGMFGWLDEHTLLVVLSYALPDGHGTMTGHRVDITKYVDGKRVEQSTISDADWPHQDFVEFVLTRGNEAWISKCVLNGNECNDVRLYRRVVPAPSIESSRAPPEIDEGRVNDHDENPWPLPPTSPAPAGVTLTLGKVDVEVTNPYSSPSTTRHDQVNGVICETRGVRATYPKTEWDTMMGPDESTRSVRWISSSPPIYEINEDWVNPAGYHHAYRIYAQPCDAPFDGYAWLGDDLWASFVLASHDPPNGFGPGEPPRVDGDWTFHRGETALGKLHGTARLRSNMVR